jgi:hypothetical protein
MGFLKKITRPISKVLDKIVPNEIKPALPFLAAAAPFLAPGIMGTSMLQRALVSGGLNLGSQLAQEGSEGDFSALSLAMASGIGALSAPGSGANAANPVNEFGTKGVVGQPSAADYFSGKAAGMDPGFAKSGLGALEKSSNYLTGVGETLRTNPFSMDGLKASLVPVGQATTDLAIAENRRLLKEQEQADADAAAEQGADNASRAFAIRQSMEAYGFTEQEILDAIEAAGYRAGGRVGLKGGGMDASNPDFGGIPAAIENIQEDAEEMITIMTDNGPIQIEKSVYESMPGMFMDTTTSAYGDAGRGRPVPQFANGGRIGFKDGTDENLVGIETLKLGEYDMEGFKNKNKFNTLTFGSDDLKALSQALDYGELSDLSNRQKEKIKEKILLARAGILDATEFEREVGINLNKSQKEFLKKITPDETVEKIMLDKEGDFRSGIQKARALGESAFFGGQKNPELTSDMYNKLGDEYIQDQKKDIQRRIDFNKEYNRNNFLNFKDGGLMNLGGKEMDLRKGGFVPIGKKERADDVPARLSKNEFVMTADAVRAAGGGSVNKGAKRMYDVMNKLEARA